MCHFPMLFLLRMRYHSDEMRVSCIGAYATMLGGIKLSPWAWCRGRMCFEVCVLCLEVDVADGLRDT